MFPTSDGEIDILDNVQAVQRTANSNKSVSSVLLTDGEIKAIDKLINSGKLSAKNAIETTLKGRNLSEFADKLDAIIRDPYKAETIIDAVEGPSSSAQYKKVKRNISKILEIEAIERFQSGFKDKGYIEGGKVLENLSRTVPARYFPKPKSIKGGRTDVGPVFAIQEGGTTRDSDRRTPAVTEVNTHGEFDQQTLLDDIDHILDNYTDQLDAGKWVAWTPGKQGRDHIKSYEMAKKAELVREYVEDNGYSFVKDNTNPGLYRIEAPAAFAVEEGSVNFKQHNDLHKHKGQSAQLNIGLENNPQDLQGTIDALNADPRVTLGTTEQVNGEFDGEVERTLVANVKFDGTKAEFDALVESLANDLTQIAIGTQFAGEGTLNYGTAHKDAKEFGGFNPDYFIAPRSYNPGDVYAAAITNHMKKVWPKIGLSTHRGGYEAVRAYVEKQTGRPISDKVKGFQWGNIIAIDPYKATPDTYIHEYVHIWVRGLQRTNPKLWKRGVELLKGTEFMRLINDNPAYRHLKKDNLSEFYNEVIANAAGKRGAELFKGKKVSLWNKWLNEFGQSVKKMLGVSSKKDYKDLTLNDFLDVVVQGTTTQSYDEITPADPAFSVYEEGQLSNKIDNITNLLNDPLKYSTNSPYKHSKIDQGTRDFLRSVKQSFLNRSDQLTESQLDRITALVEERIEAGRTEQINKRANIKENREDIAKDASDIISNIPGGVDVETLNHNDIDKLAKENTSFINRLKTRGIGGVIADALAPSSNDDFYGLISRIATGKNREKAESKLSNYLIAPLESANNNYLKNKYQIKNDFDKLVKTLGNGNKEKAEEMLNKSTGIKVSRNTLTNSQAVMLYNYIKDPRLYKQLNKAGINTDVANQIIDYIQKDGSLKAFADGVPSVYGGFVEKLNRKLDKHGYGGVSSAFIDTKNLDQTQRDMLHKIYEGRFLKLLHILLYLLKEMRL